MADRGSKRNTRSQRPFFARAPESARAKTDWMERLPYALTLSALVLAVLGVYFGCRSAAIDTPTMHTDGAFQTASSLHRLANGQAVGRDFLPYLGLGPLYALYPTFTLLGGDLHASVIASYLTVHLLVAAAFSILFYLAARPTRAWHALLPGIALLVLTNMVPHYFPNAVLTALNPGNSLRPLRAFGPYVVALVTCIVAARASKRAQARASEEPKRALGSTNEAWSMRRQFAALGAVCSLAVLWSNDYGIPSAGLFGLLSLVLALRRSEPNKRESVASLAVGVLLGALIGLLVTRGGLFKLMRYNFVDVATDQWWFFWCWNADGRILSVRELGKLFIPEVNQGLVMLALALARAALRRRTEDLAFALIGTATFFGGFIPTVGGHIENGNHGYFLGFQLWSYLALGAWCLSGVRTLLLRDHSVVARYVLMPTVLVVLFCSASFCQQRRAAFASDAAIASTDPSRFYVRELGGYLGRPWLSYIEAARAARDTTLEEYWSIWSAVQNASSMTPVDSIIHALGSVRGEYAAALKSKPARIITTRASFSEWQSWNFSASWWFYGELLKNYEPVSRSPATVVWGAASKQVPWPERACSVENGPRPTFSVKSLEADRGVLYEVTLRYRLETGNRRALLRVQNNINRVDSGYLSIDPKAREFTFPVLTAGAEPLGVNIVAAPEHEMTLNLEGCSARLVPFKDREVVTVP